MHTQSLHLRSSRVLSQQLISVLLLLALLLSPLAAWDFDRVRREPTSCRRATWRARLPWSSGWVGR